MTTIQNLIAPLATGAALLLMPTPVHPATAQHTPQRVSYSTGEVTMTLDHPNRSTWS